MKRNKLVVSIMVVFSFILFSTVFSGCCCNNVAGKRVVDTAELRVEFDFNKANVRPVYHKRIKEVADYLKRHSDVDVIIEGHTDSKGSEAYNKALSQRRADSVRQYMIDKFDIDASRITAKGFGESNPIADNNTSDGRQRNRRVIAVFVK